MKNPFTAGKWVRGSQFFGRGELLEKVLHGNRNYVWIAGTRRLGKTSVLKQLEYLSQSSPLAEEYLGLYWDLAGSDDLVGLKRSMLESLEAASEHLERIGLGVVELERLGDVFEILRTLERKVKENDRKLMLLCDECEELINIEKSCPDALPRLRRILQHDETLHTVLAASRRLGALERHTGPETTQFLQGFVPPLYLSRLSDDEAKALIGLGGFQPEDTQAIMDKTYNHPYLIQVVCERLFDGGTLDAVIEEVSADELISYFFAEDYKSLEPIEKGILRLLVQEPHASAVELQAHLRTQGERLSEWLLGLKRLGCVKEIGGMYSVSNSFFERWLRREANFEAPGQKNRQDENTIRLLPQQGDHLGHHVILEKMNVPSGMAAVYRAQDLDLKRVVALKVPLPHLIAEQQNVERFMREAQAASRLNHPNVATVYEVGEDGGRHYLSMEYVEGQTLRVWSREATRNLAARLEVLIQAGRGLAAAHAHAIVHRDIKPENVMVTEEGVVKIIDFGLARLQAASELTDPGYIVGTVPYMSPEQARGEPVDHSTDVFSFGVVMYELLAGERPFQGEDRTAVLNAIERQDPRPIRTVNPALPQAIEGIVARALKKGKTDRYPRMLDLVADLEGLHSGSPAGGRWSRWRTRRKTA